MEKDPTSQLTLAALSFPLVALAATYAIDTIDKKSTRNARILVGGIGISAITLGAIGSILSMYGYASGSYIENSVIATGLGFGLIFVLTVYVIIREVIVGMENKEAVIVLYSLLVVVLTVASVYQLVV